jgi:hypothetical protein
VALGWQVCAVGVWLLACWLAGGILLAGTARGPRVGQAIVGAAALGLQLWLQGVLGVPWQSSFVAAPWLCLAALRWRALRAEIRQRAPWTGSSTAAVLLLGAAGAVFLAALLQRPLVGYDALAFWCFKAKIAWHAQALDLPRMLEGPPELLLMRQMDYPPLWPLVMDTVAVVAGRFDEGLARAAHLLFFLGGGMALFRTARHLLTAGQALALLVAYIASPSQHSFLLQAEHMGYADHAFAVVLLVTLCSYALAATGAGSTAMPFVLAAVAALLKQEGLPLLAVLTAFELLRPGARLRTLGQAGLALVPFLAWRVELWRHGIASDLLARAAPPTGTLASRVAVVWEYLRAFGRSRPEYWVVFICALVAVVLLVRAPAGPVRRAGVVAASVLALHAVLTVLVWILSPYGTEAHVLTSIVRVASHFVPAVWLLLAVAAGSARAVAVDSNRVL